MSVDTKTTQKNKPVKYLTISQVKHIISLASQVQIKRDLNDRVKQTRKITSSAGMRLHPIDLVKRIHYGIDIVRKDKNPQIFTIDDVNLSSFHQSTGIIPVVYSKVDKYTIRFVHCKLVNNFIVCIMDKYSTGAHCHLSLQDESGQEVLHLLQKVDQLKFCKELS